MDVSVYDFAAPSIDGKERSLMDFRGQVLLIVNTASRCGFTPQYQGLEALHRRYKDQGFSVLGFPCNQFQNQEPGTDEEIQQFCELNYGVSFPLFAKVKVNGAGAHPLFRWLKQTAPGLLGTPSIKWNFTKFLLDRQGRPTRRFGPTTAPEDIAPAIEALL